MVCFSSGLKSWRSKFRVTELLEGESPGWGWGFHIRGVSLPASLLSPEPQAPRSLQRSKCCAMVCSCQKCMQAKSLRSFGLCVTPWIVARQAPLSMGFSRRGCWSGLPSPPPGNLLNPEIEPQFPAFPELAGRFFTTSATWEAP